MTVTVYATAVLLAQPATLLFDGSAISDVAIPRYFAALVERQIWHTPIERFQCNPSFLAGELSSQAGVRAVTETDGV